MQQLLLANEGKYIALDRVREAVALLEPEGLPALHGKGRDVPRWYEEGRCSDIERHLRQDIELTRYLDASGMVPALVELAWMLGVPLRGWKPES